MSFVFQTLAIIGSQFPEPIFEKSAYPHPTPFCYVLQIKDLQRSVGDRYANEGLSGKISYGPPFNGPGDGLPFDGFLFSDLPQDLFSAPL
jgi:hypothetical protein